MSWTGGDGSLNTGKLCVFASRISQGQVEAQIPFAHHTEKTDKPLLGCCGAHGCSTAQEHWSTQDPGERSPEANSGD